MTSRRLPARMTTACIAEAFTSRMREIARAQGGEGGKEAGRHGRYPSFPPCRRLALGCDESATCGRGATGGAPRRVSSRAECRTHNAMIRIVTSPTRTTRRQLICARRSRRSWRRLSSPSSARPGPKGAPALRSGVTHLEGPKAVAPRESIPRAVGQGVAQQRGLVSVVWLRPPTAALAWCAVLSPSACRRGWSGARHSSGSRPQGATTPVWLSLGVGSLGIEPTCSHLHRQFWRLGRSGGGVGRARAPLCPEGLGRSCRRDSGCCRSAVR